MAPVWLHYFKLGKVGKYQKTRLDVKLLTVWKKEMKSLFQYMNRVVLIYKKILYDEKKYFKSIYEKFFFERKSFVLKEKVLF